MSSAAVAEKMVKNLTFLRPKLGEGLQKLWDFCKSTPLLTYWPSFVEIP